MNGDNVVPPLKLRHAILELFKAGTTCTPFHEQLVSSFAGFWGHREIETTGIALQNSFFLSETSLKWVNPVKKKVIKLQKQILLGKLAPFVKPCSQEPTNDPILSHMNSVNTLTPWFFRIHFNIILTNVLRLGPPTGHFSSSSSLQPLYAFLIQKF